MTLGVDENGKYRGIFKDERIHMAVVGFPGCGKSRFLLSLAIQNVRDGDGVLIIDPHGDLVKIFLSHIPKERWKDVIYIDPITARKYSRVVKINFLECPDVKDRDIVARTFMESLEKIYAKFWGPRLDMILMNAVYALLDAGNTNLSNLYSVIADEQFRSVLLEKVSDDKVRNFWDSEFKRMPKDASSAALTKIYRIVQERIVAPLFDCVKSSIDFREAMDQRKIIVVNLSEGAITSDVANFLGSLILSRVYLAGMSREDTPEEKRVPFYVYVDEAYRFISLSIRDILQSLRKYRVYMTLASQYLGQYSEEIAESIPHLCDTIICFTVGEETAKALEEFYKPSLTYLDLVHLPKFTFAVSAIVGGRRECQVLHSVDCGWGPTDVEELVKFSLERYGEEVDMAKYTGVPALGGLPHPADAGFTTPLPWVILVRLYDLCEEKLGAGMASQGSFPFIDKEGLVEWLRSEYGVSDVEVDRALNELSYKNYVASKSYTYAFPVIPVLKDAPFNPTPVECSRCGQPTCRPYVTWGGKRLCRYCLERELYTNSVAAGDVMNVQIDPKDVRFEFAQVRRAVKYSYALTPHARRAFFEQVPIGARGGGADHARAIGAIARVLLDEGCFFVVDLGEEAPRKAADGSVDYEVKRRPDITVCPVARGKEGKLNPRHWDTGHMFTVEVEIDPLRHKQRVINNLRKNQEWGRPVIFATVKPKWANDLVDILLECRQKIVADNTGLFGGVYDPKSVSVLYIDPDTGMRAFVTPESLMIEGAAEQPAEQPAPQPTAQPPTVEQAVLPTAQPTAPPTAPPPTAHPPMVQPAPSQPEAPQQAERQLAEQEAAEVPLEHPAEQASQLAEAAGEAEGRAGARKQLVKYPIELWLEDRRQLAAIFGREWRFERRVEGKDQILYAVKQEMGKTAVAKLGNYEKFRDILDLLRIEAPLILEEEKPKGAAKAPPPAPPAEKPTEAPKPPAEAPKPMAVAETAAEPHEEVAVAPEGTGEGKPAQAVARSVEEKILECLRQGFTFSVKVIKGKQFLYAQKWGEKPKYIGAWDEKAKEVAKRLGIEVKERVTQASAT